MINFFHFLLFIFLNQFIRKGSIKNRIKATQTKIILAIVERLIQLTIKINTDRNFHKKVLLFFEYFIPPKKAITEKNNDKKKKINIVGAFVAFTQYFKKYEAQIANAKHIIISNSLFIFNLNLNIFFLFIIHPKVVLVV